MKRLLFILLLPSALYSQTVHIEDDRIVYKGTVNVPGVNKEELYGRAGDAIHNNVKGKKDIIEDNKETGMLTVKGTMRLTTPWHLIRTVGYILELSVEDGKYKYRVDSVYWKQAERGGKTTKLSSAELFKGIESTGPESIEAEKQLNEIDMNFQKLIALINNDIKKISVVKTQ